MKVEWKRSNTWDDVSLKGRMRVRTRIGDIEGTIIKIVEDGPHGKAALVDLDPEKDGDSPVRFTVNHLKYALLPYDENGKVISSKDDLKEAEAAPAPVEAETPVETPVEAPKPKAKAPTKKKDASPEPPEATGATQKAEEGSEYHLSMNALSKASGVSSLTLRKYMDRYPTEIPHQKEGNLFKFPDEAIKVVQGIKERNTK